jgi:hypothetical protein
MPTTPSEKRLLNLRLLHNGTQPGTPVPEPVRFGLQDSKGEVHPGVVRPDGSQQFDFSLEIKGGSDSDRLVFTGPFAHGPPTARFLYFELEARGEARRALGLAAQGALVGHWRRGHPAGGEAGQVPRCRCQRAATS